MVKMQKHILIAFIALIFELGISSSIAQPGSLDASFGTGGKLTTAVGSSDDVGLSVAIKSDGKIIVGGQSSISFQYDFSVVSYNSDGTLDNTFGTGGIVLTDFGSGSADLARSVAIQSDGKIVVAGYSDYNGGNIDFALARYNTDGTLDNSFGTAGKVLTPIGSSIDMVNALAIDNSNGKIIVAGRSYNGSNYDFGLARYNSDGTLDNSFSSDGKTTTAIGSSDDYCYSIGIQSDGKILAGGVRSISGSNSSFALVRYNTDGTLDNTFGTSGKVLTDITGSFDVAGSIVIQTDNKILLAGRSYNGTNDDFTIVRYNINGSIDNTFDTDGIVTTDFGSSDDGASSVLLQADGKIILAGTSAGDFAIARYNNDGTLDSSFDTDGKVSTDFGNYANANSALLQVDGKILLAGDFLNTTNTDFAVARYNGDPVGIEENEAGKSISVYPNPTNGKIQISNIKGQIEELGVYNMIGERVYSSPIIHYSSLEIDISSQPAGVYFIELNNKNSKIYKKVIKE